MTTIGQRQYFMPRETDNAGSFPQGYFGERSRSGTPYPGTVYMEMVRQTDAAQQHKYGDLLRYNPAALQNFIANQPPSTNIEDRRREPPVDTSGPDPETAVAEGPPPDPSSPLAQALGYGSIDRRPVPLPRPRPLNIGRQRYEGK